MDFEFNTTSSAIADVQNEEDFDDSDDDYAKEEATIHNDNNTLAAHDNSDDAQSWILLTALNLLPNTTARLSQHIVVTKFEQDLHHFLHLLFTR